jgi:multisubunit Na+/H+ antiporter MnhB subunit
MNNRNIVALVFFAIVAVCFIVTAFSIHQFGNPTVSNMDDYIIDNTQTEVGANNAVTSVVFDYRGFDTLGEATVLFAAVAGVIILFRRLKK